MKLVLTFTVTLELIPKPYKGIPVYEICITLQLDRNGVSHEYGFLSI